MPGAGPEHAKIYIYYNNCYGTTNRIGGNNLVAIDPEHYRLKPGQTVRLNEIDPGDTGEYDGSKDEGKEELDSLTDSLEDLQDRLYAEHKHPILIILQGMDTCGKDGTVRHVLYGVNPQGVHVANFKAPTAIELDQDYLWRVHAKTPAKGEIVIFNRSHYEDVLIVRVNEIVPEDVWRKRYGHISDFERMLADEGTTILKFFLHISEKEQKKRLLARLNEPEKHWKFDPNDINERQRWPEYLRAYEDAINQTNTEWAPWYIVPADRKWFRNMVVAAVLVDTLKKLNPQPVSHMTEEEIETYRKSLEQE
jgi:PPK2 family polyphosphate:nucleotide phosphotransferase